MTKAITGYCQALACQKYGSWEFTPIRLTFASHFLLIHRRFTTWYAMYNAVGEIIFADYKEVPEGLYFYQIDISFSPNGIYFLKLETTDEQICRKIIIVH